jgi:hypothetical protein
MSELARLFYARLIELLGLDQDAQVFYMPLALHFRPQRRLSWRGGPMHETLGELVAWCQSRGLGLLPAIVVRADSGIPGDGFFEVAFPGVTDRHERRRLWRGRACAPDGLPTGAVVNAPRPGQRWPELAS